MVERELPGVGRLQHIIEGTPDNVFETAGGFDFTDELASKLYDKACAGQPMVAVSVLDLMWLTDGYARARLLSSDDLGGGVVSGRVYGDQPLSHEVVEVTADGHGVKLRFTDGSKYGITWGFIDVRRPSEYVVASTTASPEQSDDRSAAE